MLLHCDQVVAGTDARFVTPFVALGLVPEAASSLIAPRLMGHARAFSLLVMGKPLSGEEAKAAGIVNAVAPAAMEPVAASYGWKPVFVFASVFACLAAAMIATRHLDWYGIGADARSPAAAAVQESA